MPVLQAWLNPGFEKSFINLLIYIARKEANRDLWFYIVVTSSDESIPGIIDFYYFTTCNRCGKSANFIAVYPWMAGEDPLVVPFLSITFVIGC